MSRHAATEVQCNRSYYRYTTCLCSLSSALRTRGIVACRILVSISALDKHRAKMSHWRSTTSSLTLLRSRSASLPHRHYVTASKASVGGTSDPAAYCSDFVKKYDPEAWLCHFFWPKDVRDLWLGWRAFNVSLTPGMCG
jgi:hypothetical protein